jgi:autotransporter-associated beta strand protein
MSTRRLAIEPLETRCLLASGVENVAPNSAAQGTSNLTVTVNLSSSASPTVPKASNIPISITIDAIAGTSLAHPQQYYVTGVFTIPNGESVGAKDVTVKFTGPQGNTITYGLTGGFTITAAPGPDIDVLDSTIDIADGTGSDSFGTTTVGNPVNRTFTVKNTGTADLTLAAPISVPAGFTVTSSFGATTVAAGSSTSFAVRMDATAVGNYSGTLSFANNDANESPFDFTIAGTVGVADTSWKFAVVGDTHIPSGTITGEIAASMISDGVKLAVFPGDLVDAGSGTSSATMLSQLNAWKSAVAPLYNAGIGVYAVRGNHEADATGSISAWDSAFSGAYALPSNGPSGETNLTYSFTYNNALFVGMDEYVDGYHELNQAWLNQQLAANTHPHVFVFGHEAAFKGFHTDCLDDYASPRDTFWQSLTAAGARTYFCGHDHFFDAARIDDGDGNANNDVYQVITGTGGGSLFDSCSYNGVNDSYTPVGLYHDEANGYLLVDVSGRTDGDLDVTLTFKQRTYNSTSGTYQYLPTYALTYTAPGPQIQVLDGTTPLTDALATESFDNTAAGTPLTKTFTVVNQGTKPLTLGAISVPAGFSVSSGPGATTLAAGVSTSFTVRLDATTPGSYSGTLSLVNNDGNDNPFTFALGGLVGPALDHAYTIVDTGQMASYDNAGTIAAPTAGQAFYGQDGEIAGAQPSYTCSSDGLTVYDNVTGLTWQRSADTNGDGSINVSDKMTFTAAQSYPATLNAEHYGGYNDWRLPTIKELYSLINFTGTDPSLLTTDTSILTPFINTNYFQFAYGDTSAGERVIDAQYLSSTQYAAPILPSEGGKLFGVNFADGRIKGYGLMKSGVATVFYVKCVRGNTGYGVNNFVNNGDGTVTDGATGLMWPQADSGAGMNWQDALAWVQTKNAQNYLGHNDWRLPNAKELQSLVDYTRSPDSTSSAAINALFTCTAITNEAGQADYPWYWTGTTHINDSGSAAAAVYVTFGRALGYINNWVDIHGAGAQRSDPKSGSLASYTYVPYGYYKSNAPQGDAIRIFDYVRLVRDAGAPLVTTAGIWSDAGVTVKLSGGMLHVLQTGTMTDLVTPLPTTALGSLQLTARDNAADTLTLDFSGGSPLSSGGIIFDGGSGSTKNMLVVADATGSHAFALSATQLTVAGSAAVTFSHLQAFTLDLGNGSLDLGGTRSAGSLALVSGQVIGGTLTDTSLTVQGGVVSSNVTGSASLTKSGSGSAAVSATNTYTGSTTVSAGALLVQSSVALPASSDLVIADGASLILDFGGGRGAAITTTPIAAADSITAAVQAAAATSASKEVREMVCATPLADEQKRTSLPLVHNSARAHDAAIQSLSQPTAGQCHWTWPWTLLSRGRRPGQPEQ